MLNEANVAKCDLFTTLSVYDIGTTLVKSGVLNNKLALGNLLKYSVPSLAWEGVLWAGRHALLTVFSSSSLRGV